MHLGSWRELLSALLVLSIGFGLVVAIEARDGMGIGLIVAGCAAIGLLIQRTALTVPKAGVADELEKLTALRDRGLLTETEYQEQKARLLGQ